MTVFDTGLFIDEIEKRPAVWDMSENDYSNKILRGKAWEELVNIFCNSDDTEEKKRILALTLKKKWRSLRDHYVREVKKLKSLKSSTGTSKISTFAYFTRLKFLRRSAKKKGTVSNVSRNNECLISIPQRNTSFKSQKIQRREEKIKQHSVDKHFADLLEKSLAQKQLPDKKEDEDEDRLFCLSLINEIRKVPESKRLQLKIKLYNMILQNQITKRNRSEPIPFSHKLSPCGQQLPNDGYYSTCSPPESYHNIQSNRQNISSPASVNGNEASSGSDSDSFND